MDPAQVSKKIIAFGSKQVFLPKFTIALIRTPRLSPYHARFLVPLNFSKYDLRDYLYHAYNVKVHNIRSIVKQQPIRDSADRVRHWFRPESKKYMTVEMEKPFVWPADPPSWEPWGREEKEYQVKTAIDDGGGDTPAQRREQMWALRNQAKDLIKSRQQSTGAKEDKPKKTKQRKGGKDKSLLELWEEQRTPQTLGYKGA